MSYIRLSTRLKKRKRDNRFEKISNTYAWYDTDGYVHIANGWKRQRKYLTKVFDKNVGGEIYNSLYDILGSHNGQVILTPAEMRHMCKTFVKLEMSRLLKKQRR